MLSNSQETTPQPRLGLPQSSLYQLDYQQQLIIQHVLRLSLEDQNTKTFSQANGLSSHFRKMIKSMKMGRSSQKCSVCIESFKQDQIIKKFPCKHIFHRECAKSWLKVNKRCPICRLDVEAHFKTQQEGVLS